VYVFFNRLFCCCLMANKDCTLRRISVSYLCRACSFISSREQRHSAVVNSLHSCNKTTGNSRHRLRLIVLLCTYSRQLASVIILVRLPLNVKCRGTATSFKDYRSMPITSRPFTERPIGIFHFFEHGRRI